MRQNKRDEYRNYCPNCKCYQNVKGSELYTIETDENASENRDKVKCIDGDNVYYIPRQLFARVVMGLEVPERKYVRYKTGAKMYDMSERQFFSLANDAKAKHKINKLVLIDLNKIDRYISYFAED